ncbi:hypothetical protein BDA96_06G152800 [Sorghum bicolor]|uniref:Uncharacterized protein n=1 Tax=Sorghum bicolor TaxID=4558 RepID=A0A921QSR8_SORBI|nr:hypothetical protein BDA96_06G152800 [Sorghum bicolor]
MLATPIPSPHVGDRHLLCASKLRPSCTGKLRSLNVDELCPFARRTSSAHFALMSSAPSCVSKHRPLNASTTPVHHRPLPPQCVGDTPVPPPHW